MDALTLFGLLTVTAMLVFYALEDRSPWFILAFAGALRARIDLWPPPGRLAFWRRRGNLGGRCRLALARQNPGLPANLTARPIVAVR